MVPDVFLSSDEHKEKFLVHIMQMGALQKPHKVNTTEDIDLSTAVVWISIVFAFVFLKHSTLLHYKQREGLFFLKSSSEERKSYTCWLV